jgi:rhodanese-related sulfurtransferase
LIVESGFIFSIFERITNFPSITPEVRDIGKGIIERDIEAMVPGKQESIVLYCGGGYRSVLAADALQRMGYENVRSMVGGNSCVAGSRVPP